MQVTNILLTTSIPLPNFKAIFLPDTIISQAFHPDLVITIHKKWKISIKDFFSRCDQTRSFLRIWPDLLKKSLMENFISCVVLSYTHDTNDMKNACYMKIYGQSEATPLTLSWRRYISYRSQSIDLQSKSTDWFLYARKLHHERNNYKYLKRSWEKAILDYFF